MSSFFNYYFKKMRFKKREGVTLIECLILLIVTAFSIGAILQTFSVTTQLQMAGRRYVDSHKNVVSYFHTLESIETNNISTDIFNTVRNVNSVGDFSYVLSPEIIRSTDAVVTVRVFVINSDRSHKSYRPTREISKDFSRFTHRTVSDDRMIDIR